MGLDFMAMCANLFNGADREMNFVPVLFYGYG